MGWQRLQNFGQVGAIVVASAQRPQLIFKHSTRCSISAAAKYRLDADITALETVYDLHFLDLLVNKDISRTIAERFDVTHQSPQVIVVENGKAVYVASHYDIDADVLLSLKGNERSIFRS